MGMNEDGSLTQIQEGKGAGTITRELIEGGSAIQIVCIKKRDIY